MKKALTLIIAAALAISLAACSEKPAETASSVASEVESVVDAAESTVESAVESVEDAVSEVAEDVNATAAAPELDGYTRTENGDMIAYTNSTDPTKSIVVVSSISTPEEIEKFNAKDEAYVTALKDQFAGAVTEGVEINQEFKTIEGKEVLVITVAIKANPDAGIPADMSTVTNLFASSDKMVSVTSMNADEADVAKVIAAL